MRWWDAIALLAAALTLAGTFATGWHLASRRAHRLLHRHPRPAKLAPIDPAYAPEADWPKHCACRQTCGDDGDIDGPGVCKGLPHPPPKPLVEIVLVDRHLRRPPAASEPSASSQTPRGDADTPDSGR